MKCEIQRMIEEAGAEYVGPQKANDGTIAFIWFSDPVSGSSLGLPEGEITVSKVQAHIRESRARFRTGRR